MKRLRFKHLLPILILAVGLGVGWELHTVLALPTNSSANMDAAAVRESNSGYKFINPLLECNVGANAFVELKPLESKVETFIDAINDQDSEVNFVALYFRDLNDGPWFGINEDTNFSPASLLKVPVLIAYYKLAEDDPSILQKEYTFHNTGQSSLVQQNIIPAETLVDGKTYTVDDLLSRMIIYSDNLAQYVLMDNLPASVLTGVYNDFGFPLPGTSSSSDEMTVKGYSSFFRVLFNASYLDREYSEKALDLLSQSQFKSGLVAGVSSSVMVAHKFGERGIVGDSQYQLHDCGIVYYPNHPYLLCVMSRGNDLNHLAATIAKISQYIYTEVDSQYSNK